MIKQSQSLRPMKPEGSMKFVKRFILQRSLPQAAFETNIFDAVTDMFRAPKLMGEAMA